MVELLGNIGDFVGGIGVVVSLLYLAYQIRSSRLHSLAEDTTMAVDRWLEAQTKPLQTEGDVNLIRRAYDSYEGLTPEEKGRFAGYMFELNAAYQAALYVKEKGLLDTRQFDSIEYAMAGHMTSRGARSWWAEAAPHWPDHVRERVDRIMVEHVGPPFSEVFSYYRLRETEAEG